MAVRVPRFYQAQPLSLGEFFLDEEASRHALSVLRLRVGQEVTLFNGDGYNYQGRLLSVEKRAPAGIDLYEKQDANTESSLRTTLGLSLSRKEGMDYAIQKATELGVSHITPLLLDYCDVKHSPSWLEKKARHWQKVIVSACEQCGRAVLPTLAAPLSIEEWLSTQAGSRGFFFDTEATQGLNARENEAQTQAIAIVIGPEGGFSSPERLQIIESGFEPVRVGPRVLRFETAVVTALSLAQQFYGDFTLPS